MTGSEWDAINFIELEQIKRAGPMRIFKPLARRGCEHFYIDTAPGQIVPIVAKKKRGSYYLRHANHDAVVGALLEFFEGRT